jgi:hypothetical protein
MTFVGKPEEKRSLGRPCRRWEYNIKMYIQEEGWGMDHIDLAQDRNRRAGFYESGNEPLDSIK